MKQQLSRAGLPPASLCCVRWGQTNYLAQVHLRTGSKSEQKLLANEGPTRLSWGCVGAPMEPVQPLTQPGPSASVKWDNSSQGAGVWAQDTWYPEAATLKSR